MTTLIAGVLVFTGVVLTLVLALGWAHARLLASGEVHITVNDDSALGFDCAVGRTLLAALNEHRIHLPSACGGQGTCGTCKVRVREGGGALLPTERGFIRRSEARDGVRLACQLKLRSALSIELPESILGIRQWRCRVRSNANLATFIKELVLELPEDLPLTGFRPGSYVQAHIPPHAMSYRSIEVEPRFRAEWDRSELWSLSSDVERGEIVERAYSLANDPRQTGTIVLNVRIALPPPGSGAPPGKASSYLFSLKEDDSLLVSGPFGDFFIQETDAEIVYIGGGAGMAPLRSHLIELFHNRRTTRRVSYWYGARSLRESFYLEELERLAAAHPSFSFHLALSDPQPEDEWDGSTGFIHEVVYDSYLRDHPAPEEVEYYLCGPPLMLKGCLAMLSELGVPPEHIFYDAF